MMSLSVVLQENFPQIHRAIAATVADSFQDLSAQKKQTDGGGISTL